MSTAAGQRVAVAPRRGRGGSRDLSTGRLIADYRAAGAGSRRKLLLVAFIVANGFLEGLALTALIPALNAGLAGSDDAGLLGRILGLGSGADHDAIVVRSLIAFAVLGIASSAATLMMGRLTLQVRADIEANMRQRMTDALLAMPWLPYLEMRLGDITKSILLDGSKASTGVVMSLQALGASVVVLVFLALAFAISPPMTLFTLAFGAVAVVAYRRASARASSHAAEVTVVTDGLSRETTEVFGGFKYVLATGLTGEARKRTFRLVESYRVKSVRSMLPQTSVRFFYESSGILFVGGFLAFSLLAASAQVGSVVVFLGIFFRLTPRVTMINDSLYQARVLLPWYDSWRRVYDAALSSARPSTGTLRKPGFEVVEARGVDFSYPTGRQVLSDVSVELRRGRCVALVGESGSGKTTLMDLFIGLLDPGSGTLTVDGAPMADIDRGWWHRQLGLVLQDSTIFSTTVLENVALGDDEPDRDRALECLGLAAARDFVLAMPDGLDSHVGERGAKLSGGQRQRLALARALYRDPGLLCLDEATAALDGDSEALILDAVSRIKRDRAVLLASHRVTTLAIADEIVVFDAGRIVERGSWDELMAAPTRFRRLVESQS